MIDYRIWSPGCRLSDGTVNLRLFRELSRVTVRCVGADADDVIYDGNLVSIRYGELRRHGGVNEELGFDLGGDTGKLVPVYGSEEEPVFPDTEETNRTYPVYTPWEFGKPGPGTRNYHEPVLRLLPSDYPGPNLPGGSVMLCVVGPDGKPVHAGRLCAFTPSGNLYLYRAVDSLIPIRRSAQRDFIWLS